MQQNGINSKVDAFISRNEEAIIGDIAKLVAVRSVQGEPAPGAPYGAGPRKALAVALEIAADLGLETADEGGHVGWAELKGARAGYLATITHLDIVPEGEGWDGDPFVMRQKDGWLLGRGVMDNKGPSVLCLYAAKFFKEQAWPLRYGLRVLLGSDEESGMQDVEHYLKNNPEPLFAFSPDAGFPLCNGEKGVYSANFVSEVLKGNLVEFKGGIASNVVPDRAHCVVRADAAALAQTDRIQVAAMEGNLVRLDARGVGGHAAQPQSTVNAIGLLVEYLLENKLCSARENTFLVLLKKLHDVTDGSGLGIACSDDMFDPLTCIGGMIELCEGRLRQNVNIRYPMATSGENLTATLRAQAAQAGGSFENPEFAKPFYIEAESAAIQTLLQTYNEVSGRNEKPFTMGGGTYARHFKHAVSFGPELPGEAIPAFAGEPHSANEGANIQTLRDALKIYILSLVRLQELEL